MLGALNRQFVLLTAIGKGRCPRGDDSAMAPLDSCTLEEHVLDKADLPSYHPPAFHTAAYYCTEFS